MCTGAEIGLILTAVGGTTSAVNTGISNRRRDRTAAEGIRQQGETQAEANRRVNERVADIAQSTPEAERTASLEGFLDTLRSSSKTTGGDVDPLALGGSRFAERVGSGEAETRRRGVETSDILSRIDSPLRQRTREAGRVGDTALELDELGRQSQAQSFINQLRVASKRPNVLVEALAQTAKGAGSILALRAPGVPKVPGRDQDLLKLFSSGTLIDAPMTPFTPGLS